MSLRWCRRFEPWEARKGMRRLWHQVARQPGQTQPPDHHPNKFGSSRATRRRVSDALSARATGASASSCPFFAFAGNKKQEHDIDWLLVNRIEIDRLLQISRASRRVVETGSRACGMAMPPPTPVDPSSSRLRSSGAFDQHASCGWLLLWPPAPAAGDVCRTRRTSMVTSVGDSRSLMFMGAPRERISQIRIKGGLVVSSGARSR